MPIDPADAALALAFSNQRVLPHTDCVLRVESDGRAGLASCILLDVASREVAVTCAHVLRPNAKYFIGPNRLEQDRVPDDPGPKVHAAQLLGSSDVLDLALFSVPNDEPEKRAKRSYSLRHAEVITEERVASQLKTASFICAVFGEASTAHQYPDGLVYTQLPIYSALGPIVSCTSNEIIADMAEKEIVYKADHAFPQLRDMQPTGGVRDLHGISGSGLWVKSGEEMFLIGIALGRAASSSDEHLVRATPVWSMRTWIGDLLPKSPGS